MAAPETFFKRLTRLFRSGPAIRRRVTGTDSRALYSNQLIQGNYGYRASAPFGFGRENSPYSVLGSYGILDRMARYAEFGEMEYCLVGDTKIAVPGGYKTLKELADEYGTDKDFIVYSYDHNQKKIVPALGKQARKTRTDHAWKVTFDNGKEIIGTADHRLMKRDGTYCEIQDLEPGAAMMPFYRKAFYPKNNAKAGDYLSIYDMDKTKTKNGWRAEHRIIAEWAYRDLLPNEVVHHKNFVRNDNRPENLQIMDEKEHLAYHSQILNGKKWDKETNGEWIESFKAAHSTWMRENNPSKRKDVTFGRILETCENVGFNIYKVSRAFDTDLNVIKRRLRENGFQNFVTFAKAYNKNWKSDSWDNSGKKNPRFNEGVTFEKICDIYARGMSQKEVAKSLGVSITPVSNRIKENGYTSWSNFTQTYNNLKVKSVEYHGVVDLYDLTVDGYKNFATDTVISHNTPEIAAALNIYSEETVGGDDRGKCFHVYSDNSEIKAALDELFYDVLNVEFNIKTWVRNLVKYGDFFLYNEVLPDMGVIAATPISVSELEREEGFDLEDPHAYRFKWLARGNQYLEAWQISHFRILGNDLFLPYGTSVLEPARRIWRQLTQLEDAMLVYRIVRSPERRAFFIDVGNIDPNDIENYMEAAKASLRSQGVMDNETGREDMRMNVMSVLDDYFIPVRGAANQSGTRIESLSGGQHVSATDDVEYIQRKLFAALQVPKPYLNFDENLSAKASLAQMDIRFSRSIQGLQKIIISELNRLAMIHLFSKGFDGADLIDFVLKLSNPSSVALQQKLELWDTKFNIGGSAKETELVDKRWIQRNILELTEDEIDLVEKNLIEDRVRQMEAENLELEKADPTAAGSTTDPFDPTNYQVPGADVSKNPAKTSDTADNFSNPVSNADSEIGLAKFRGTDEEGNMFVVDLETGRTPIKATPFMTRHRRNRKRRVGAGKGRSNTAMPDLSAMLSSKNKYTKDVYGQYTENVQRNKEGLNLGDIENFLKNDAEDHRTTLKPMVNQEMRKIFERLKNVLGTRRNKILTEESELLSLDIDEDQEEFDFSILSESGSINEDESKLIFEISSKKEVGDPSGSADTLELSLNEKTNDDFESIDEKTLSDVFKDKD